MPPRSRTKPGSTTRRAKVAGLRQHVHATSGAGGPQVDPTDALEPPESFEAPESLDAPASLEAPESLATAPATEAPAVTDEAPVGAPPDDPAGTPSTATPAAPTRPAAVDTATAGTTPVGSTTPDTTSADTTAPAGTTTAATATATEAGEDPATVTGTDATTDATTETDGERPTAAPTRTGRGRSTGGAGERARRRAGMAPRPEAAAGATTTAERPGRQRTGDAAATTATTEKTGTPGTEDKGARGTRFARVRSALARFAGSRALPITLAVVVVVCLVLSGLAFWQGRKAWTTGPVSNQAVVDVGGTAELVGQTREAIEKIFSYDFTRLDDSVDAARSMSTGDFTNRYLAVFDQTIRAPAVQQQLRQTASVINLGVVSMRDDRAEVMALAQFSAQRTTTGQSTNAPGLLRAEMQRVDGRWKLAELTPLTNNR